jgi:hypothetical protein
VKLRHVLALVWLVIAALAIAACASPLTVAEPRDGVAPTVGVFADGGPLDASEDGEDAFLGDPLEDASND